MEDKKTIIDKLKAIVFSEEVIETEEVKFAEVKTLDGKILRADELVIDAEIKEIGEDGEVVAVDGEYKIEGGVVIVVVDGKISDIKEAVAEEEEAPAEEEEMEDEATDVIVDETIIEDIVTETVEEKIAKRVEEKTKELEDKLNDVLAKFSALGEEFEKFSKSPAEDELKIKKVGFKSEDKTDSKLDALSKYRNKK